MLAKGFEVKKVNLLPVMHKPVQRLMFGQATVPGVVFDGERVVGSRRIMQRLDQLVPEPALYPADPAALAAVEEAELWGDDVLQAAVRRLLWAVARHAPKKVLTGLADPEQLPIPLPIAMASAVPMVKMEMKIHGVTPESAKADLKALPALVDHVDAGVHIGFVGDGFSHLEFVLQTSVYPFASFQNGRCDSARGVGIFLHKLSSGAQYFFWVVGPNVLRGGGGDADTVSNRAVSPRLADAVTVHIAYAHIRHHLGWWHGDDFGVFQGVDAHAG